MPGTTDTVKTILTPGEFVIRKEAVDMIGVPMLNMINDMPEKGGHSSIDKIIQMATLANMKGMYGGGMVNAGPKPMQMGGMVDEYGHGGMVNPQMMMMMEEGGELKPVPEDNPGLAKLPEEVRNKMGYMQNGGMVEDSLMGMMGGGMMNQPMSSYQEGGEVSLEDYAGLVGKMVTAFGGKLPEGMYTSEGGLTREGIAKMYDLNPESVNIDTLSFANPANYMFEVTGKKRGSGADVTETTRRIGSLPIEGLLDTVMNENIEDPSERMRFKLDLNKIKNYISYQGGGLVGYQEGGMAGLPAPPMDDPLQIEMRQANPQMLAGQSIGVPGEMQALEQSMMQDEMIIQQAIQSKAEKALQQLRLLGLLSNPQSLDSPDGMMNMMPSPQKTFKGRILGDMLIPAPNMPK